MSSSSSKEGIYVSDDVLLEIFLFLPADSIIRFRFVCKYWFNLITYIISNPRLVQMHMDHHSNLSYNATTTYDKLPTIISTATTICPSISNYNLYSLNKEAIEIVYPFKSPSSKLEILGYCNGLLCIKVVDSHGADHKSKSGRHWGTIDYADKGILCLWNPSTNEFKQVPAAPIKKTEHNSEVIDAMYGFGYDRFINDYKIVRFVKSNNQHHVLKVYTLETNSWKTINSSIEIPISLLDRWNKKVGLYVEGALHWITKDDDYYHIYSFSIEDGEFREVPKPECANDVYYYNAKLQVLRGCLCILGRFGHSYFEMWMMVDYGVKESWTRYFRVVYPELMPRSGNLWPIWFRKNGEVLLGSCVYFVRDYELPTFNNLVIYEPNNKKVEFIDSHEISFSWLKAIVHIGTLVSLKSGTYVDQEQQPKRKNGKERNENKNTGKRTRRKIIFSL